ncbi:MAG: hypothetical protein ABI134_13995, partial [Byssovorax sp.]
FKELEEKIDAQREDRDRPKKKPPPLRPAAGRSAEAATLRPAAEVPATPPGPARAETVPPVSGLRVIGGEAPQPPSSASSRLLTGAGTEYMVMSPFATGEFKLPSGIPPAAPPPPPASGDGAGFGSGVHAAPFPARTPSVTPPDPQKSGAAAATKPKSRRGIVLLLLAIALLSAGAFAAWLLFARRRVEAPPPLPAPAAVAPAPTGS